MRILLLGEASFVHTTLKAGLQSLGHEVVTLSDGNNWHDAPRDISVRRDMRWGVFGGLGVLWKLLCNVRYLMGNDIVQLHNYQVVPLGMKWNIRFIRFLKRYNRCVIKLCLGDDPQVIESQLRGTPAYSDIYWGGSVRNVEVNRERIAEQRLPNVVRCWREATKQSDALVTVLYEYYLNYFTPEYKEKLHYIPLPVMLPPNGEIRIKGGGNVINILVGLQPKRDYIKGAAVIAKMLETLSRQNKGKLAIKYVEGVPYDEYCRMLSEADVLVDQLYSYTPSMNSLAAMARGTVVIGGGEEDFYRFIGERDLRPIINVRPDRSDEENISVLREALLTPGNIKRLSCESVAFVRKHYDYIKVARQYEALYKDLKG